MHDLTFAVTLRTRRSADSIGGLLHEQDFVTTEKIKGCELALQMGLEL
jgi:hypothetical protein